MTNENAWGLDGVALLTKQRREEIQQRWPWHRVKISVIYDTYEDGHDSYEMMGTVMTIKVELGDMMFWECHTPEMYAKVLKFLLED